MKFQLGRSLMSPQFRRTGSDNYTDKYRSTYSEKMKQDKLQAPQVGAFSKLDEHKESDKESRSERRSESQNRIKNRSISSSES